MTVSNAEAFYTPVALLSVAVLALIAKIKFNAHSDCGCCQFDLQLVEKVKQFVPRLDAMRNQRSPLENNEPSPTSQPPSLSLPSAAAMEIHTVVTEATVRSISPRNDHSV